MLPLTVLTCAAVPLPQEVALERHIVRSASTNSDQAQFQLGPAQAVARVQFVAGSPRIEVVVKNTTEGPLWWRGAGIGCISFGSRFAPVDESGQARPEYAMSGVGCSMERSQPATAEQCAEWRLQAGESRSVMLHPFKFMEQVERDVEPRQRLPKLSRWVEEQEFTLPRADPPPETMDFECPIVVFAWDQALGLRVFVDGADGDVDLPHFDPFDATPFFREDPAPIRLGGLRGEVSLNVRDGHPGVTWTLLNEYEAPVTWSMCAGGPAETPIPPGGIRSWSFSPCFDESQTRVTCTRSAHASDRESWSATVASTWPVQESDLNAPAPPAWLHVAWDAQTGVAVGLAVDREPFDPFGWNAVNEIHSPVRRIGDAWWMASTRKGYPLSLELRAWPTAGGEAWLDRGTVLEGRLRWMPADEAAPDAAPVLEVPPLPPSPEWDPSGQGRLEEQSRAFYASVLGGGMLEEAVRMAEGTESIAAWEWVRWVWTPGWGGPGVPPDHRPNLLRIRWHPEGRLDLREEPPR